MSAGALKRPALGRIAELGTFYNARTDEFLDRNILLGNPPEHATEVQYHTSAESKIYLNECLHAKFQHLDIHKELEASILAGLCLYSASADHLSCYHDKKHMVQGALYHTVASFDERLDFKKPGLTELITHDLVPAATHIVAGISWGSRSVVCAKHILRLGENRQAIQEELDRCLHALQSAKRASELAESPGFDISVYTDVTQTGQHSAQSFGAAFNLIQGQAGLIESVGPEPISYTLLPLNLLEVLGLVQGHIHQALPQPSDACLHRTNKIFEHLQSRPQAESYLKYISRHQSYVPAGHVREIEDYVHHLESKSILFKQELATTLQGIRSASCDPSRLDELVERFERGEASLERGRALIGLHSRKVRFLETAVSLGARYFDSPGSQVDNFLACSCNRKVFVVNLNPQVVTNRTSWPPHERLVLSLLQSNQTEHDVLLVDNVMQNSSGGPLEHAYIASYKQSNLLSDDYLSLVNFLQGQCLAKYDQAMLDKTMTEKPVQRRPIKMHCPGLKCPKNLREWICSQCHGSIEFGFVDVFVYCECGACPYEHWEFKCSDRRHGPGFERHNPLNLLQGLQSLEPFEELNILILGETGVGKSTFINAFINYLTYSSLDEAMKNDALEWVIPCSFSTQFKNKNDPDGRLIQKDIKIGSSDDEHDGSRGSSATQRTTVHSIWMHDSMIRLIDTPGIGDVRGADQDRQNMADILSVLRGYERLHCVLVLLKPNNSRLNVMFRFCVKELLTHLHRSAAHNMVFGFTNTRASNYTPGDTFKPLEELLNEYRDRNLGLFERNVYCFDSESFRYLAAKKSGHDLGNFDDYRRSWEQSGRESHRLMNHIRTLKPHEVKSTMNLNETRALIAELTKPMAEIAQRIKASIAINKERSKELADRKMSKEELMKKLQVQKQVLTAHQLTKPRTVCANRKCIEFKNDGATDGALRTVYKTICHNPCYLQNVPVETVGHHELVKCYAFQGQPLCQNRNCRHRWEEHLHVLYELKEETKTVKDETIDAAVRRHESAMDLKALAIKRQQEAIEEFELEHKAIQLAAARFSVFLKKNSITPYNDATIEYLDHLIKQEKDKVQVGASPQRLRELEAFKAEHAELIRIFTFNLETGKGEKPLDAEGVEAEVSKLFQLKHFGANLRDVRKVVEVAHAATFREKPYHVKAKRWHCPGFGFVDSSATASGSGSGSGSAGSGTGSRASTGAQRRIKFRPPTKLLPGIPDTSDASHLLSSAARFKQSQSSPPPRYNTISPLIPQTRSQDRTASTAGDEDIGGTRWTVPRTVAQELPARSLSQLDLNMSVLMSNSFSRDGSHTNTSNTFNAQGMSPPGRDGQSSSNIGLGTPQIQRRVSVPRRPVPDLYSLPETNMADQTRTRGPDDPGSQLQIRSISTWDTPDDVRRDVAGGFGLERRYSTSSVVTAPPPYSLLGRSASRSAAFEAINAFDASRTRQVSENEPGLLQRRGTMRNRIMDVFRR